MFKYGKYLNVFKMWFKIKNHVCEKNYVWNLSACACEIDNI